MENRDGLGGSSLPCCCLSWTTPRGRNAKRRDRNVRISVTPVHEDEPTAAARHAQRIRKFQVRWHEIKEVSEGMFIYVLLIMISTKTLLS
jgi:hypothetical protein